MGFESGIFLVLCGVNLSVFFLFQRRVKLYYMECYCRLPAWPLTLEFKSTVPRIRLICVHLLGQKQLWCCWCYNKLEFRLGTFALGRTYIFGYPIGRFVSSHDFNNFVRRCIWNHFSWKIFWSFVNCVLDKSGRGRLDFLRWFYCRFRLEWLWFYYGWIKCVTLLCSLSAFLRHLDDVRKSDIFTQVQHCCRSRFCQM